MIASPVKGSFTSPDPSLPRALDVEGLTVELGGRQILEDISFWVPRGEFACLCGPNGAGKSTFLKTALGFIKPTRGRIEILGKAPSKAGRAVGYVPQRRQSDRNFPARAVDLIAANLRGRWPLHVRAEERERALVALRRVAGEHLIDKSLSSLSGGEAQRVFLARALVTNPSLLILDEPTAGVDVKGRGELLDLLAEIARSGEVAALLVTHNLAAVARCAQRIIYIDGGRLAAWGLPNELLGQRALSALASEAAGGAGAFLDDE
jgi:ABC-type Mn2+/Zn2+ transport system ATPase subunit